MKKEQSNSVLFRLNRIKEEFGILTCPESKAALLKGLDEAISSLSRLRRELSNPALESRASEIKLPLEQVIRFLERAHNDEALQVLLTLSGISGHPKPKRPAIDIPPNLTNEQIRDFLQKDLSKAELKLIATQRAISVTESSMEDIRRSILKNLERQEGYGRLSAS